LPLWTLRDLDGARLRAELAGVLALTRDYLRPMVDLWYPHALENLGVFALGPLFEADVGTSLIAMAYQTADQLDLIIDQIDATDWGYKPAGEVRPVVALRFFDYFLTLEHNSKGQATGLFQFSIQSGYLPLQSISYGEENRVAAIEVPGRGRTTFSYDADTGPLVGVVGADGVAGSAVIDPVSDALRELGIDRGDGATHTASFRYDGQERLAKAWDDVGVGGEQSPELEYRYAFALDDRPSVIASRKRLTTGSVREDALLATAGGTASATMTRQSTTWAVGQVARDDANTLESRTAYRGPLAASVAPEEVTWASLSEGADPLDLGRRAGFGHALSIDLTVQSGVTRHLDHALALEGGTFVITTVENGTYASTTATDLAGRTLWARDQLGTETHMRYDGLGRLVRVDLPDQGVHTLTFDHYGRPSTVGRQGLGSGQYVYDVRNGLLAEKRSFDAAGVRERSVSLLRDAVGRVVRETRVRATSVNHGASRWPPPDVIPVSLVDRVATLAA
jgi:YD repeat-containing protein